jgi:Protein of unknown function (DUF4231)
MSQVTLDRLENEISWYDRRSNYCQKMYKGLKLAELVAAAGVPLCAGLAPNAWVTGALGVTVVVLEGIQQLNQYHSNWMSYRSTAEALKHEKYLHAAKAGPYAASEAPDALLAERVEGLISQQHAKWVTQQEPKKPDARP